MVNRIERNVSVTEIVESETLRGEGDALSEKETFLELQMHVFWWLSTKHASERLDIFVPFFLTRAKRHSIQKRQRRQVQNKGFIRKN